MYSMHLVSSYALPKSKSSAFLNQLFFYWQSDDNKNTDSHNNEK